MEARAIIGSHYTAAVIPMIAAARTKIDIIVYEWRLYPTRPSHPVSLFTEAIHAAAARGVAVRAIVASDGLRDELRRLKIKARSDYTGRLLHAKLILIDEEIVVLGSHNFTQAAFSLNVEVSASIHDADLCRDLSTYFDNLYGA